MRLKKRIIRVLSSVFLIAVVIFSANTFCMNNQEFINIGVKSLSNEEKNTMDYVVIGSSASHADLFPTVIWKEYNITGHLLCVNSADSRVYKSMCNEKNINQDDALLIIDMDGFTQGLSEDIYPTSTWIDVESKTSYWLKDIRDLDGGHYIEHLFPIIKYHNYLLAPNGVIASVKNTLYYDIYKKTDFMKGASNLKNKKRLSVKEMNALKTYNQRAYVFNNSFKEQEDILTDFLDFCNVLGVRAVFVDFPKAYNDKKKYEMIEKKENASIYFKRIIEKYGQHYVNYSYLNNPCKLDKNDFVDSYHLNQSGAIKFSNWFGEYLLNNFSFEKKEKSIIDMWDKATRQAYEEFELQ